MAALFKKKAKASDIAGALVRLATDAKDLLEAVSELPIATEQERELVAGHLMMLQLFAVDYATATTLGRDSPEKNAVLDSYYSKLEWLSEEMGARDGVSFFDDLRHYLVSYTKAVQTPHHLGSPWTIGKEFARLCNKAEDADFVTFGSFQFSACLEWTSKLLKTYRIKV